MIKALMVCLGLEPRVAGWKVHMYPLSYGGTPIYYFSFLRLLLRSSFLDGKSFLRYGNTELPKTNPQFSKPDGFGLHKHQCNFYKKYRLQMIRLECYAALAFELSTSQE